MQKMLDANAEAAAAVVAGAQQLLEEVRAERAAAKQALLETQENTAALSAAFLEQHRDRIETDLREQIRRDFAIALLQGGAMPDEVSDWLGIPEAEALELSQRFGYERWKDPESGAYGIPEKQPAVDFSYARLTIEEQGRSGTVIFQLGKTVCRFWYELAGGDALAFIDVPTEAQWEAHTKLPLAQREAILHFIGKRTVADKAPGYRYRIDANSITIY